MKTVVAAIMCSLLTAGVAQAKAESYGLDLFANTCVAASPNFESVEQRIASLGGVAAVAPNGSLNAMIAATSEQAWTIVVPSQQIGAMVVVAQGNAAGQKARSCFVMLKGTTVPVADVEKAFPPLATPIESAHVFYGWKHLWDIQLNGRPAIIAAISADSNRAQSSVLTLVFVSPD